MNITDLWLEYKSSNDPELKKQLVVNYIKLVHYVIHKSKFVNLDLLEEGDYFQFGIEGLSEAVDRFDPKVGTKFETYAIQRIRGKIIDELRKIQAKQRVYSSSSSHNEYYTNVSLNSPINDEEGYMLYETIANETDGPDTELFQKEASEFLANAIKELEERDRLILSLYYYEELSYKEIAQVLNITVSRVSQVHSRIIKELKNKLALLQI